MSSTSSTQTVRRSKRLQDKKNSASEQPIGTESGILQTTQVTATIVIEQLPPDAAMASTRTTQQIPRPKRGRKRKNSSPERPIETESENHQIQDANAQETTTSIIEQLPLVNTSSTQTVRRSKRLRNQNNSSSEQQLRTEFETLQIQGTTTRVTTTVIEQLLLDAAMASTSSTQQTPLPKRGRKRKNSSPEQLVGTVSETLQLLLPDTTMPSTSSTQTVRSSKRLRSQKNSSPEQPVETELETLQIQEIATQETTTRATTPTVIEQLPPDAAMAGTSFTQQISSHEQSVETESETLQIQETTTQDLTTLEMDTQEITTRMATPTAIEQLLPNAAMASTSSTQQISSHEQPVGTESEILQIQETITQDTTVTLEIATQETITRATTTSSVIEQLLLAAAMPSTSYVAMASTSSTQQREQSVGTETFGRETSLNEQPAGAGPVEAPSTGGTTNENNGEREARPAKKKKKSKKSKRAEKRLARFKTCCSLLVRERMIRAEQQRIYLIERNKVNDLREEFVIVGPTGNVYTVTIAHLPDCTCPDFMKGFLCKHIFFVYLNVLGVNRDSTLIYQKALLSKELRSIFTSARLNPTVIALKKIRDRYKRFTSSNVNENENEKRRPIEGNCPICYDSLEEKDRDKIVWCRQGCGNNIHKDCFEQWKRSRYSGRVTCVYCRVNWVEPEVYITDDGYINLGSVQRLESVQRLNVLRDAAHYTII